MEMLSLGWKHLCSLLCFQILGYADHVFTGLFTIEIILKVVFGIYNVGLVAYILCVLQYAFSVVSVVPIFLQILYMWE